MCIFLSNILWLGKRNIYIYIEKIERISTYLNYLCIFVFICILKSYAKNQLAS